MGDNRNTRWMHTVGQHTSSGQLWADWDSSSVVPPQHGLTGPLFRSGHWASLHEKEYGFSTRISFRGGSLHQDLVIVLQQCPQPLGINVCIQLHISISHSNSLLHTRREESLTSKPIDAQWTYADGFRQVPVWDPCGDLAMPGFQKNRAVSKKIGGSGDFHVIQAGGRGCVCDLEPLKARVLREGAECAALYCTYCTVPSRNFRSALPYSYSRFSTLPHLRSGASQRAPEVWSALSAVLRFSSSRDGTWQFACLHYLFKILINLGLISTSKPWCCFSPVCWRQAGFWKNRGDNTLEWRCKWMFWAGRLGESGVSEVRKDFWWSDRRTPKSRSRPEH